MVLNYYEWYVRHGLSCRSSSFPVTPKCSIDCRPSAQVTTAYSRSRSTGRNYSRPWATLCGIHSCVDPSRDRPDLEHELGALICAIAPGIWYPDIPLLA